MTFYVPRRFTFFIFEGGQKVVSCCLLPADLHTIQYQEMFKLPLLWFLFFTQVLHLTALLEVLSEYNLISILHWTAQRDLTCFLCFFPLLLSLSHCSPFTLFHSILVSTPLLLLCSLCLKMVSIVTTPTLRTLLSPLFRMVPFFPLVQYFL